MSQETDSDRLSLAEAGNIRLFKAFNTLIRQPEFADLWCFALKGSLLTNPIAKVISSL